MGVEIGDHRTDASVIVVGLGQVQLGENAADVLFDGACRIVIAGIRRNGPRQPKAIRTYGFAKTSGADAALLCKM